VTVGVIELLERVEVAEEQRHLAAGADGRGDRCLEPVLQRAAVGEPGQRVLEGERGEQLEQLGALRLVGDVERRRQAGRSWRLGSPMGL